MHRLDEEKRVFSDASLFERENGWNDNRRRILSILAVTSDPLVLLNQRVKDHVQPVTVVVGKDTPVEALFSLFGYLPAVLVVSGEKVLGIITKIDILAART